MKYLPILPFLLLLIACAPEESGKSSSVLQKANLVAWCIVPFDKNQRRPEERAQMLQRLELKRMAYDWREEHVAEFEEEILACQKYGIEYFAFWDEHPKAFALFEKYDMHPQVWKMLPPPVGETQAERVASLGTTLLPLVEETRRLGCKLGIYNHGGWQGQPVNMVAIVEWLRSQTDAAHVGIVYNQHHGHEHIDGFAESLALMQPYLHCLNLNGMNTLPEPKILGLGKGKHDQALMKLIVDSGYDGPIGIIGHRDDQDMEEILAENLEGLQSLNPDLARK